MKPITDPRYWLLRLRAGEISEREFGRRLRKAGTLTALAGELGVSKQTLNYAKKLAVAAWKKNSLPASVKKL